MPSAGSLSKADSEPGAAPVKGSEMTTIWNHLLRTKKKADDKRK